MISMAPPFVLRLSKDERRVFQQNRTLNFELGTASAMKYTRRELMVVAAAREIREGDKVFVGMRLPLLGFAVAKETHAPNALGIFENGVIRDWPALESIFTMSDPPNVAHEIGRAHV